MSGADIKKGQTLAAVSSPRPCYLILLPNSVQDDPSAAGYTRARDCWHWRNALLCHSGDRHWPGHPVQANTAGTQCHPRQYQLSLKTRATSLFSALSPARTAKVVSSSSILGESQFPRQTKPTQAFLIYSQSSTPCIHPRPGLGSSC